MNKYYSFTFYRFEPSWRRLPVAERKAAIAEFTAAIAARKSAVEVKSYLTVGLKRDCEFGTWAAADSALPLVDLGVDLVNTAMWGHLTMPHQFLAITKPSPYGNKDEDKTPIPQGDKPWLFVYPFVKTKPWYQLPLEERGRIMREHIAVGNGFPTIRINTAYSFGIDDQEFVVSFEGDDPVTFVELVQKLRSSRATAFTERDTPMFTCLKMDLGAVLEKLSFKAAAG